MTPAELEAALRRRVDEAAHGERLPPVRTLKREYGVGQAVLQEILCRMAHQGLLQLQVGRGMFVQKPGCAPKGGLERASVLMLSMRAHSDRSRQVARLLQEQLSTAGARCERLVYERIEDALAVLRLTVHFDACVLQSSFDVIPLGLLAFLRERGVAVVADGTRVTGVDIDAVASDWRGALDAAVDALIRRGHRRIALLAWPGEVQPLQGLRHHFGSLRRILRCSEETMPLVEIDHLPQPGESPIETWQRALTTLWSRSDARPTAIVVWGLGGDGSLLAEAIAAARIRVPQQLSVMLLGHVDVAVEHRERFDVIGSCAADAARALVTRVRLRIDKPHEVHATVYLPLRSALFGSVAAAVR